MTAAEISAEIAEINVALAHIRKGGQSYMINSAAGAGTMRTVTMANYRELVAHRDQLQARLDSLNGTRAFRVGAGW